MIDVDLILGLADTILLQYSFIYHEMLINSITLSDAMLHHGTWSILVQLMATKCRYNMVQHDFSYGTTKTEVKYASEVIFTKDTPYLALTGELQGVFYMTKTEVIYASEVIITKDTSYLALTVFSEDFGENWLSYNGTTQYLQVQPHVPAPGAPEFLSRDAFYTSVIRLSKHDFLWYPNGSMWPHKLGVRNFGDWYHLTMF